MGIYKWTNNDSNTQEGYRVIFFVSRNKDNVDIPNFKERRESYFRHYNKEKMAVKFREFVERGVPGEFSRMYISNNARDPKKVHKELLKLLIDKDEFNFDYLEPTVAGIAAQRECAAEKKWFFDFDDNNYDKLVEFILDIEEIDSDVFVEFQQTPHGYAVITNRGFDTRKLFEKWGDVASLKRDDLLFVDGDFKEYI